MDQQDVAEQFEKLLNSPKQSWLLGAGVSYSSNVPLMIPLTKRVLHLARTEQFAEDAEATAVLDFVQNDISQNANIEIFLTHLADLISMAERSRTVDVAVGAQRVTKAKLTKIHVALLQIIARIVRWGYRQAILNEDGDEQEAERIGAEGQSIVTMDCHDRFVKAIFGRGRAGLEGVRGPVELFTTNYDTLLEDALSLNLIEYSDGFVGGGVGYWGATNYINHGSLRAFITKLHGSVDWFRSDAPPSPLLRRRHGDTYPSGGGAVMIYPQATKYMNAQLDPFSDLFQRFRNRLADSVDQVLLICGYSFGDDHINADIEAAMAKGRSQLTIIAFSDEREAGLPKTLQTWRTQTSWKDRIYIASPKGLYRGSSNSFFSLNNVLRNWWTFEGATTLVSEGLPRYIQEAIQ